MPDNKKQGRSNKAMTFFVCFLAALAGLLFGLDIGVIAGALPFITDEFQITAHTQEWVVSSMMFGAAVGAVGSGWLSFKLGRKKSLMIGAILFVAGSLFSAAAPNVEVLIIFLACCWVWPSASLPTLHRCTCPRSRRKKFAAV